MFWEFKRAGLEIRLPNETKWFDVSAREWFPKPPGKQRLVDVESDAELLLYETAPETGKYLVFDRRIGSVVTRIDADPGAFAKFVDSEQILVMSDRDVVSVTLFDTPSGRSTTHWQPFAWVMQTFILVMAASAVWLVLWLMASASESRHACTCCSTPG